MYLNVTILPRQLANTNMASVEAIHLGLSLASLVSAGFMLWNALLQNTKWLHLLQLCV